ncbi:MAG TPA: DNA repair protein RecN [Flavobacteriales bacterium]|nr:DNA repair protein RecN [Flavobacteriales bacterium]
MLRRLTISNYLLIGSLELDLDSGLTIITGETGSGKSILIGALALAMGERAESGVQRDPAKRCVIELEVDHKDIDLTAWFGSAEIPMERSTILRRQIEPGGRSRAFVNDTPVRLETLRELGEKLVHVHSQHHTLLLNDARFQLGLVDHVASQRADVVAYAGIYSEWRSLMYRLSALREEGSRANGELDYLRFQLEELEEARLLPDEQPAIEQELVRAENAEELIQGLRSVEEGIGGEAGIVALVGRLRQALAKPARLDTGIHAILERLNSTNIELKDIGDEAERIAAGISIDPARARQLRDRLDRILRLQQKHRVKTVEELIAMREDLRTRVGGIGSLSGQIATLEEEEGRARKTVLDRAEALSHARIAALEPLANKVEGILQELGMPHAVFQFEHRTGDPGPQGIDTVRALFSANKDRVPSPLDKVASGGELSRVMLALISLAADSQDLPTVIFDEVDTGVSGEVADRVGSLMARMGKERQVIAITHLPQIASKADIHLLVSKEQGAEGATTMIRALTAEERVEALAQMLSGRKLTKAAVQNARVLLKGG